MVSRQTHTESAAGDRGTARPDRSLDRAAVDPRGAALGAKAGLVATVVMSAFRWPISASPPPTAWFWSEYVAGGNPEEHHVAGIVLHLLYGVGAGAAFGGLFARRVRGDGGSPGGRATDGGGRRDGGGASSVSAASGDGAARDGGEVGRERRGTGLGFLYGVLLSLFGVSVVLERLLGMDLEPDERFVFHVSHVVYGLTLGAWFGSNV
ncbi:MAG: hypothetical protein ABEJ28_03560 [Salinigranum sp.]